jgi:hypothetical protein
VGKKLLVILGIAAVAGYLFRDRIIAGGLTLAGKVNQLKEDIEARVAEIRDGDGSDYADVFKEES